MDVTTTEANTKLAHPLKSWSLSPRRIGRNTYQGKCVVAEALHVQYQKESSVRGYQAGVFGFSHRGDGLTLGGGGMTTTTHRDVVQVVFRDQDGAQQTHELPSKSASTVGCVTRLDMIGENVIGCRNLSGKGQHLQLHDATSFIDLPRFGKLEIVLGVLAFIMFASALHDMRPATLMWVFILGFFPGLKAYRIMKAHRERRELNGYMGEVFA